MQHPPTRTQGSLLATQRTLLLLDGRGRWGELQLQESGAAGFLKRARTQPGDGGGEPSSSVCRRPRVGGRGLYSCIPGSSQRRCLEVSDFLEVRVQVSAKMRHNSPKSFHFIEVSIQAQIPEHCFHFFLPLYQLDGEGTGSPLQDSCLEKLMSRAAWGATVHRVTKSRA